MVTDKILLDWKKIRKALKDGDAALHADYFGNYWMALPVDPAIARQIIAHPAICLSNETDAHQTYRWRTPSQSPAKKVLSTLKTEGSVQ